MLRVDFLGSDQEAMKEFVDFISESLVGWKPFVNNEVTISDPESFGNKFVAQMTIGQQTDTDYEMLVDYDRAFFEKATAKELNQELHNFWNHK